MLTIVTTAAALIGRPDRAMATTALAAAAVLPPWITAPIVSAIIWRRWSVRDPFDEVVLLQAAAAELRAGSSLRHALVEAARRVPELPLASMVRMCTAGRPMDEVAEALAPALHDSGAVMGTAVRIAAESGGQVAAVFSTLAAIQSDVIELRREVAAATAGVRASVLVVAGLPVAALAYSHASGQLSSVLAFGTPGIILLATGGFLLATGTVSIALMARTAR